MMTLPGTPVLRYGDEIGMGDDLSLPERNCGRTPMQWSDEPQGGFSKAEKTTLPVITDDVYGYKRLNAAVQRRDQGSLLNFTERLIRMRKECPEIGWGDFEVLPTRNPAVLAICYSWRGNSLVCVHNFDEEPHAVKLTLNEDTLVSLFTNDHSKSKSGVHTIALDGYDFRWYRVGGLGYILNREK
jgi:maltose alpha-D-glucosyltransferase/alpha-amylase